MPKPKFEDGVKIDHYRLLSEAVRAGIHGTCNHFNDHHDICVPEEIIEPLEEQLYDEIMLVIDNQFIFEELYK